MLDAAALERRVLGLTEADAKAALGAYGDVAIALWPGWVDGDPDARPARDPHARGSRWTRSPRPTPGPSAAPAPSPTAIAVAATRARPEAPPGASRYHPADAAPPAAADSSPAGASGRHGPVTFHPPRSGPAAGASPPGLRMTARILGIDLGAKRIGLAVADAGIGIARPLATVNRAATLDGGCGVDRPGLP